MIETVIKCSAACCLSAATAAAGVAAALASASAALQNLAGGVRLQVVATTSLSCGVARTYLSARLLQVSPMTQMHVCCVSNTRKALRAAAAVAAAHRFSSVVAWAAGAGAVCAVALQGKEVAK